MEGKGRVEMGVGAGCMWLEKDGSEDVVAEQAGKQVSKQEARPTG